MDVHEPPQRVELRTVERGVSGPSHLGAVGWRYARLMARAAFVAILATVLALAGCGGSGDRGAATSGVASLRSRDVVFFGLGASTNPDIGTPGAGIGVVEGVLTGHPTLVARSDRWVAIPDGQWLTGMRLLANKRRLSGNRPVVTRSSSCAATGLNGSRRFGSRSRWIGRRFVSPDGRRVAATQAFRAGANGRVRPGPLSAVASITGQGEHTFKLAGELLGWADAHRLAFLSHSWLEILDLRDGARSRIVSLAELATDAGAREASVINTVTANRLIGSADGTLVALPLALTYAGPHPLRRGSAVAIVRIRDHTVRLIKSPLQISMFTFAPQGDRYAYTTSVLPRAARAVGWTRDHRGREAHLLHHRSSLRLDQLVA